MHAPWWVYLIAIPVALPVFVLWAVGGLGLAKFFWTWIIGEEPARPAGRQMGLGG